MKFNCDRIFKVFGTTMLAASAIILALMIEEGMKTFNAKTLEVCQKINIECLDLASILPKDTSVFADEVHFNENGANQVAETLKNYLESKPTFNE